MVSSKINLLGSIKAYNYKNNLNRLKKFNESLKKSDKKFLNNDKKLKQVSEEMESIFVYQMLKEMDSAFKISDTILPESHAQKIFKSMLFEKYAEKIAQSADFGIAKAIYNEFKDQINTKTLEELKKEGK